MVAANNACNEWPRGNDDALLEGREGWKGFHTADCAAWRTGTRRRKAAPFRPPDRSENISVWLGTSGLPSVIQALESMPVWHMCYGGSFATRREHIYRWPVQLWRWMAEELIRGDNIIEGHYAERVWGALLSPPLSVARQRAILCATHRVNVHVQASGGSWHVQGCSCGARCHKPGFLGYGGKSLDVSWTYEGTD